MCLEAWKEIWSENVTRISPETLCLFLKLILTHNVIQFNGKLVLQVDGLGMGVVLCPPASNGVMKIQLQRILSVCLTRNIPLPLEDDRFMDDRFHLWTQSLNEIERYNEACNSFTLVFTTDGAPSDSKDFLDITVFIKDKRLETKLYRNPVSKSNFYLNFYSAHPRSTTNSIPFSLALRIVRNCSQKSYQDESLQELREALISNCFYPVNIVDDAISRAKALDRKELIQAKQKVNENEIGRSVLSTPFHPTITSLPRILHQCVEPLRGLDATFDKLTEVRPLVAWNKCTTLKQHISPSKFPREATPLSGSRRCHRQRCEPCKDALDRKNVSINGQTRTIRGSNTCDTNWIVYGLCCTACDLWYIGKTLTPFKTRWSNHKSKLKKNIEAFRNNGERALWDLRKEGKVEDYHLVKHFCEHGSFSMCKWVVLDCIGKKGRDPAANLLKWEHAFIDYFGTKFPGGLNSKE